ncbi:MAG: hypothetical protein K2Y23_07415 [Cyanobacteria bacterium]|nr:hypothetical protein [Cyanobacteriota bacterium]
MKCVITLTVTLVLVSAPLAMAQSTAAQNRPLAEVAKDEEARRKQIRKPARVITNANLRPDNSRGSEPAATGTAVDPTSASAPVAGDPEPAPEPEPAKTQAYWQNRIKTARDQLQRTQLFADSLQTRINSLTTDFVNRDDPAQRAKIQTDRQQALGELERVKKELTDIQKNIAAIEEEARRAGVPSGWLRPGA